MIRALPLLAILLVALARGLAFPSAPLHGQWSVSGELARPRAYASATTLPTGEILVFGGFDEGDPEVVNSRTELIDATTGTVTSMAQRLPGRIHHTVTLAAGDRVVVAGGVEWSGKSFGSTDRVDVYLPYEHRWTAAKPLRQARSDHGAVALGSGEVLVTGGNFNVRPLASSEIYDPRTDRWREAAPLLSPRLRFSIAPLPDGRVLVAGGLSGKGEPLTTTELYDPVADRWERGPDLALPRVQHALVSLPGGDLLFVGGSGAAAGTAERYDVSRNAFVYAGSLAEPRLAAQATALADGRVLIVGGALERIGRTEWEPLVTAEIWDRSSNLWSAFAAPALPRVLGELVATRNGAYVVSGLGLGQSPQRAIERLLLH